MKTLYSIFSDIADRFPNKTAIVCNAESIDYLDLKSLVDKISGNLFSSLGVDDTHIGLAIPNSIVLVATSLAISKLGRTIIPINIGLKPNQIRHLLESTDTNILFTESNKSSTLSKQIDQDASQGQNIQVFSIEELLSKSSPSTQDKNIDIQEEFLIILSSGSTGKPKPIVLSQNSKIMRAEQAQSMFNVTHDDIILCASPFFHSLGQRLSFLPLLTGCTLILLDKFSPSKWIDAVEQYNVSFTIPVSSHLNALQDTLINHYDRASSLRCLVSSSADIDPKLKSTLAHKLKCEFHEMYGTTETATATDLSPSDPESKINSVGLAYKDVDIKILDNEKAELDKGIVGEIACKTPLMFSYYYKQPDITESSIYNGYFLTGDLGYLDSDNYLYFVSRKKDVIITGGINVIPGDIEHVLKTHPDIKDCSVIGVNDQYFGESIFAICVSNRRDEDLEKELRKLSSNELAPFQQPLGYDIVEKLPLTPSGKIDKPTLRNYYNSLNMDLSKKIRAILNITSE